MGHTESFTLIGDISDEIEEFNVACRRELVRHEKLNTGACSEDEYDWFEFPPGSYTETYYSKSHVMSKRISADAILKAFHSFHWQAPYLVSMLHYSDSMDRPVLIYPEG